GFLYIASLKTGEWDWEPLPAVYEVDTRDNTLDTGRLVWQIPMKTFRAYFGNSLPYFDIVWVHSDAPVGPFKPWAQLADPVYAPTPQPSTATITPTMIPTPPPLFHVGQTVRVQTIDGEILNLRAAPTRKSEILVYIEDDTLLELLEGPVEAEGYYWWRVHTPDGLEGWVVENDGELQTILPE
ncbi:MAG: SH3 domain-containing protein, partial [Anaerolineae bacterium]|nr:SH3 domain-containing protein [Anaerolineae bacterium]